MKIAVASQNRRTITEHAGKCRKFWIYETEQDKIVRKELLELPREQSFHDSSPHSPHPLNGIQVLIAGSMGQGLSHRLAHKGIVGIVTPETDPDRAVTAYLDGSLAVLSPGSHDHDHDHGHGHGHGGQHRHPDTGPNG